MKRIAFCFGLLLASTPVLAAEQGGITIAPDGLYQTFPTPSGSMTLTPHSGLYQRFDNPGGSTTFGPNGQMYQQFNTPAPQPVQPFGNPFASPPQGGTPGWGR